MSHLCDIKSCSLGSVYYNPETVYRTCRVVPVLEDVLRGEVVAMILPRRPAIVSSVNCGKINPRLWRNKSQVLTQFRRWRRNPHHFRQKWARGEIGRNWKYKMKKFKNRERWKCSSSQAKSMIINSLEWGDSVFVTSPIFSLTWRFYNSNRPTVVVCDAPRVDSGWTDRWMLNNINWCKSCVIWATYEQYHVSYSYDDCNNLLTSV